ncbi:MAG: DNA-3-methyladenine glycosylase [Ignavibacteria bacterium]|nr:DNA-3-methyladenine glycosylase [Ignavibacteria bacterium]
MPKEFIPDFSKSLTKDFYLQSPEIVARALIGTILVRQVEDNETIAARIVETEAYLANGDLASHSAPGLTMRNAAMFEAGGIIYIYFIYGMHYCMNVVTEPEGIGSAVLLRAAEPLMGIDLMMKNRNSKNINTLCKGPGNLAKAFGFVKEDNFTSLQSSKLYIQKSYTNIHTVTAPCKRIGISKSEDLLLRFLADGSPFITRK